MGVVTGILPTTGLPLPFFSAGGTSVSMIMAAVGILLNISRENGARAIDTRRSTEWRKNMRYRKRKKAAVAGDGDGGCWSLAVLAVLFVLACSQVFKVRSMLVVGNRNHAPRMRSLRRAAFTIGDNLLSLSDTELKKRLETEPIHRVYRP